MATVGSDKRLNYYQMTGDSVVQELASHRYGLTTPEAKRRLAQNGSNIVHAHRANFRYPGLIAQPWLLGLLAVGVVGALYTHSDTLVVALIGFGAVSLLADLWREHTADNLEYHLHQLLPTKAIVRRNDQAAIIDAAELVIGDIIELEVGTRVPADVRLLHTDHLMIDESDLMSTTHAQTKYSHPVTTALPLAERHNQAYAGTLVVAGSGRGIVIATGAQTEAGRLLAQAEVIPPKQSAFLPILRSLGRRFSLIALIWLVAIGLTIQQTDLELQRGAVFAVAALVALLPLGLGLAFSRVLATFNRRSKYLHAQHLHAIDRLASIDTIITDETLLHTGNPTVQDVYIGKLHYHLDKPSLQPKGKLLNDKGKPVSKKALAELEQFFDAITLSTQARLLAPDATHQDWRSSGNAHEGALIALVSQAGTDPLAVREQHGFVGRNYFDHQRRMTSSIHHYHKQQAVFVHGDGHAVLARTISSSEGGHTRKLTAADIERYRSHIDSQIQSGNSVIAVAYRKLPKQSKPAELHHDVLEKDLILLGFVSIGTTALPKTASTFADLTRQGIATIALCTSSDHDANTLIKRLTGKSHQHLDGHDISLLDDTELLNRLSAKQLVITHPTPEQKLRIVALLESAGHRVLLHGTSLADIPAQRYSTISLCSTDQPLLVRDESDFVLNNGQLSDIASGIRHSREIRGHLQRILHSAVADHSLQIGLVLVSFSLYLAGHIPMITTALLLITATTLQTIAYSAIGDDASDRKRTPTDLLPHPSFVNTTLGLIAGLLISANFLYFFVREGISPEYIDDTSNLFLRAATLGFVSLVLCMWINLVFSRSQHSGSKLRQHTQNRALLKVFIISTIALAAIVYVPAIQQVLGSRGLTLADWLCAAVVATSYMAIRLIAHSERRHSRRHLVALHQEIHGTDSPAQL